MQPMPTIAVLSSNIALSAVLAATLRQDPNLRVREFRDARAVATYMRVSPISVLVGDYDLVDGTTADLAERIRIQGSVVSSDVQIIVLTRTIDQDLRRRCVRAGVDEIIVKPMSPLYLEERVRTRLGDGPRGYIRSKYVGPDRRDRLHLLDARPNPVERRLDNVIPFRSPATFDVRPDV